MTQSQAEMNRTAADEFAKADAELTRVYKQLIAQLAKARDGKRTVLLRDCQRAWIKFRDTQARFDASDMEGGSAYPLLYSGSLRQSTTNRTAELKELLKNEKSLRG